MARAAKSEEAILQREFITKTDIKMLFNVGERKASTIFDAVQKQVTDEGKLNIPGRISWRRMYKMYLYLILNRTLLTTLRGSK